MNPRTNGRILCLSAAALAAALAPGADAQCTFTRSNLTAGTATYSQGCGGTFTPGQIIDASPATGWALGACSGGGDLTLSQTVAFELVNAVSNSGQIRVKLFSGGSSAGNLTVGRFRVLVTGDATNTFCDGLANNGDVTATWTPLVATVLSSSVADANGNAIGGTAPTLTKQGDNSIVASGADPVYAIYTITAPTPIATVTGVRIEFVDGNGAATGADLGLPTGGPGRHPNGNCIVRDFTLETAPGATINQQPQPVHACYFGVAGFAVSSNQAGATYQWRKNGTPINGATQQIYSIQQARKSDIGSYDCVVTTPCGSVTSNAAALSMCPVDWVCDDFVDFFDFDEFLGEWGVASEKSDYDEDGFIDFFDLEAFRADMNIGC